jgi:tRNA G26 N,N-dimethylase Trm1
MSTHQCGGYISTDWAWDKKHKNQPQKIRFSIDGPLYTGDVNVKDIKFENGIYCIVSKKEHSECLNKEQISIILKFVDKNTPDSIYFGMVKGSLKMKKVK